MIVAVVLIAIVVLSLLFHFISPWWTTPLASNWQQMDDTLTITLVITGLFFVAITLFLAWTILRYRHRKGHSAAYEPENRKLERWLIALTTIGIIGLLAPGLAVYAEFIQVPKDALEVEVLGQQWQWRYRFPGEGGKLGMTDGALIKPDNPFGIDPGDPAGQDDILINNNELRLPLDRPVRVVLRSQDVLHDAYVPQFRARMNMVPGMVSTFWFTPTKTGRYELMCAQLCGVGHANMRGIIVVEEEQAFRQWLAQQPTFAMAKAAVAAQAAASSAAAPAAGAGVDALVAKGQALAQSKGCIACHSVDGSPSVGPTWKGLYGKTENFTDGGSALVDEKYLKDFIRNPKARNVKGYPPIMPQVEMSDEELDAIVTYIKSLGGNPQKATQ